MRKLVFISGPILGMEDNQEYRERIAAVCLKLDLEVIDPWLREKLLCKGDEERWWDNAAAEDFIKRDLEDAERCDLMVVYMPMLSAGACMELFYAKRKGKKVIVVSALDCLSPWIVAHSDVVLKDMGELEEHLKRTLYPR